VLAFWRDQGRLRIGKRQNLACPLGGAAAPLKGAALSGFIPPNRQRFRLHKKAIQQRTDTGAQSLIDAAAPASEVGDERREGERRRPRSDAQEGENLLRGLLRFSSDWYWEQDENFRFTSNLRDFVAQHIFERAVGIARSPRRK